jgi:pentatricopeptide repeat protein
MVQFTEIDRIYAMMKQEGINADLVIYNALMHGYNALKRYNETKELFDEMISKKIRPDLRAFSALFAAHFYSGKKTYRSYGRIIFII